MFYNLLFNAFFLVLLLRVKEFTKHLTHFFFTFLLTFFPMLIVNGILTSLPVVEYNSLHICQLRIYTIPVEDFAYGFLLLLMSVFVFEYALKIKNQVRSSATD